MRLIGLAAVLVAQSAGAGLPVWRMEMTAEDEVVDPAIDHRYTPKFNACQGFAVTTDESARCYVAEFPRQDARLNAAWRAALARVAPADKPALRAAQRHWIAERDPFCNKQADGFRGGSIVPIIYHMCRTEQTIRRTLWLEAVARR